VRAAPCTNSEAVGEVKTGQEVALLREVRNGHRQLADGSVSGGIAQLLPVCLSVACVLCCCRLAAAHCPRSPGQGWVNMCVSDAQWVQLEEA